MSLGSIASLDFTMDVFMPGMVIPVIRQGLGVSSYTFVLARSHCELAVWSQCGRAMHLATPPLPLTQLNVHPGCYKRQGGELIKRLC